MLGLILLAVSSLSAAPLPSFSRLDSLFLIAATGEPRFAAQRDSCERVLVGLGAETLDYLVAEAARPARSFTPRQRHYVERLFTVVSDSGRNPAARAVLARAVASAPNDTLRARWLYIGSRMADSAFRDAALQWLNAESAAVRRTAARVLGAFPRPANIAPLLSGIDTLRGADRHARLWALGEHAPLRDWKRLIPLLSDEDAFNRRKVRDLLLKATDSSWTALRRAMPKLQPPRRRGKPEKPGDPELRRLVTHEWRLLALEARGGKEFLEKEKPAMTAEERRFFGIAP